MKSKGSNPAVAIRMKISKKSGINSKLVMQLNLSYLYTHNGEL
jgi:hypothetical protein